MGFATLHTEIWDLELTLDDEVIMRWVQEALLATQLKKNNVISVSSSTNTPMQPQLGTEEDTEEKRGPAEREGETTTPRKVVKKLREAARGQKERVTVRDKKTGVLITMPPSQLEKLNDAIQEGSEKKEKVLVIHAPTTEEKKQKISELLKRGRLTGGELAEKMGIDGRAISRILYFMASEGILKKEEEYTPQGKGKIIYYSLGEPSSSGDPEEPPTDQEKEVLGAIPERRWLRVKSIRSRVSGTTANKVGVLLNDLVKKGYLQKQIRKPGKKNPDVHYTILPEKEIMREFFTSGQSIEEIAQKYDIPIGRVRQIISSEKGKLYASVNGADPSAQLHQLHKQEIKQEMQNADGTGVIM